MALGVHGMALMMHHQHDCCRKEGRAPFARPFEAQPDCIPTLQIGSCNGDIIRCTNWLANRRPCAAIPVLRAGCAHAQKQAQQTQHNSLSYSIGGLMYVYERHCLQERGELQLTHFVVQVSA